MKRKIKTLCDKCKIYYDCFKVRTDCIGCEADCKDTLCKCAKYYVENLLKHQPITECPYFKSMVK